MTSSLINSAKRSILLSLAFLLAANSAVAGAGQAATPTPTTPSQAWTIAKWTTIFLVAAGATRFFTREGNDSPVRYDKDKILNFEDMPDQLFYLLDDGVIGHAGHKPYDEVNKENNRIERKDVYYPKGVGGWTAFYYKSVLSALGATWAIATAIRVCNTTGTTPENFLERFLLEVGKQASNVGLEPILELAVPVAGVVIGSKLAS